MARTSPSVSSDETLTQVQEAAVEYNLRATRPNDHRVRRVTASMVRQWCEAHGYTEEQAGYCVQDTFDHIALERVASGYRLRGTRWVRSR
jgi:hypothetical protein